MQDSSTAGAHPFDDAMRLSALAPAASAPGAAARWQGHTSPAYWNMVGPFGGITAAQALNAILRHPDRLGDPVALTVNYAAALSAGAFHIEARPVRTNRSTQHWTLLITQPDAASGADAAVFSATAVTARRRETWSAADNPMPAVPAPEQAPRMRLSSDMAWPACYDLRPCAGELPTEWNGAEADSVTRLWMRDEPPRPLDFCSLAALADVFYPRVWRRRALMTPAGTVSMTVYFHAGAAELAATGTGYLLGQARGQSYFNGFFDQSAELWNQAGHLLATTHQIVYFKE